MRQRTWAILLPLVATQLALGHGGTYRGPDGLPPSARHGATCGPSRAPLAARPAGGVTVGGVVVTRGTAPLTPRGGPDLTHAWDWWWEHNGDRWLAMRAQAARDLASATGRSTGSRYAIQANLATLIKDQIRTAAIPALRAGLSDPYFDARAASVIALGKVLDPAMPEADEIRRQMRELVADPDHEVRESACLGLGLLGAKAETPDLVLVMKDQPSGRILAGVDPRQHVLPRERGFAAVSAGLIGARVHLDDAIASEILDSAKNDANEEVRVAAVIALGSMRSHLAVPELRRLAANPDATPLTRAHAIGALARLSDPGCAAWLLRSGLEDASSDVQRSSVIALGLLAPPGDEGTAAVLSRRAQWANDRPVRNFALIALGQIGSPKAVRFLLDRIRSSESHERTFAALGIGICGAKSKERRAELGEALLRAWNGGRDELDQGAFAIALGLLEHQAATPTIVEAFRSSKHKLVKGHLATGLALLGAKEAAPLIRELAADASDQETQGRARKALALLGDPGDAGVLLEAVRRSALDADAMAGAAFGLGLMARKDVVPMLCEILTKRDEHKDDARAFAGAALGLLGDKDPVSLLTSLRADSNYLATTDAFRELARIY